MEVTDPREPLFGRRFEVLSIARGESAAANVLVRYEGDCALRIPLRATNLFPLEDHGPRATLSRVAVEELLSLVKEYESCPNPGKSRRKRSGRPSTKIAGKKSLAQTVLWFASNNLKVPRRDGRGDIHWKQPTVAGLGSMVKNPAYAGAFAYGRTRWKTSENTGKKQQTHLPVAQWRFLVRDKYPPYISWEIYRRFPQRKNQ